MSKKILAILLLATGFVYFVARDRQKSSTPTAGKSPEDVLIDMVQAMGSGDISAWLDCFGGDLGRRLRDLTNQRGSQEVARMLKERNQLVKGLAIVDKQPQGQNALQVFTETVYADKNTRQSFLLKQENNRWKIVQSDWEVVSTWNTRYGRSVREEN